LSNLTARVLVALVGIPCILLLTLAGGFYFFGLVIVLSSVALSEFYALSRTKGASPQVGTGLVFGGCVTVVFLYNKLQYALLSTLDQSGVSIPLPTMTQALLIVLLVFVLFVFLVELLRTKGSSLLNAATTILGVVYVSLFMGSLVGLRELFVPADFPVYRYFDVRGLAMPAEVIEQAYTWGGYTVVTIFAAIWLCDSAAYFAGTIFGKHKLFERISPRKTWEGAIAGFVFAVGTFIAARELVVPYLSFGHAVACGAIVGVFGQLGDMVESMMKRDAGVKDSSALIPGHGGVLDRFDSLIFVSPVLFLYLDFIVF